jgi:dihydroorotate dehydrogenase
VNGGGTVHLPDDLEKVLFLPDGRRSRVAATNVGSIVKPQRDGNSGVTYWSSVGSCLEGDIDSHNSKGLWGKGWFEYYELVLPLMIQRIHECGIPAIVNHAAFDSAESKFLTKQSFAAGADLITLNWSCGNTGGDVLAFEESFYRPALASALSVVPQGKQILIKMPYFPSRSMLRRMAKFLHPFDQVGGIIAINTLPNGLQLDPTGTPYITPFGGLAGVGGAAIRGFALGQCLMWLEEWYKLKSDKAVIGIGGIQTKEHAQMFLEHVGVHLIKTHTAFRESDSSIFGKLEGDVAA